LETGILLKGKRVLIVDDEPDVLETLEVLLSMCETVRASEFNQARVLLESQYFDMAILDIMGVNGYKLLEIANNRKVTAVMLTAHAISPEHIKKSYQKGAAYYIPKDEIAGITTFLEEILEAQKGGKSPWARWFERFAYSYCEKKFGPRWQEGDTEFWKNLRLFTE
jgi:DNA-binding NtrC family response regulator